MTWLEALILGIIQGLTEFLPVSSSGHIEIGKALLGVNIEDDITFTVLVHFATVLSTIVVLRKDISKIFAGLFKFKFNEETQYVLKIIISMIPVGIVGVFFKDYVENLFNGGLWIVGIALLATAILLCFAQYFPKILKRQPSKNLGYIDALIIGFSQAVAVIPGLSRSGTTISTGLLCGVKKEEVAKFSFLMVLVPIIGESLLDVIKGDFISVDIAVLPMFVGFVAAFVSGFFACKFMINLVKKGSLLWFAIYCVLAAILAFVL
ncbi:undecaprenyl-diphosphatase [Bacteroidia bacterium]|nr:undecaprenyl-diphosphatase [Bacteroidia bacterium]